MYTIIIEGTLVNSNMSKANGGHDTIYYYTLRTLLIFGDKRYWINVKRIALTSNTVLFTTRLLCNRHTYRATLHVPMRSYRDQTIIQVPSDEWFWRGRVLGPTILVCTVVGQDNN
jgi:hypothetical protein